MSGRPGSKYKPKIRNKKCTCRYCSKEFLAAEPRASICSSCMDVVKIPCSCKCGELLERRVFEVQEGQTFKLGHSKKGKTYLELYGTSTPSCGFKKGELNVAKRQDIKEKISASLKAGAHWVYTCPEVVKRKTSKLEDLIAPYLVGWKRQHPVGKYELDFALVDKKQAIEINGCYWHNCELCGFAQKVDPVILAEAKKKERSRTAALKAAGWSVEGVWEHSIPEWVSKRINSSQTTITRYHDISAGHRVVNHEGACARLHGHNYRVFFTCTASTLDIVGRIIDFSVVKKLLCMWLEDNWDHRFLVWEKDPWKNTLRKIDNSTVVVSFNPTAENIAQFLVEKIGPKQLAGTGVHLTSCKIEETRKCSATVSLPKNSSYALVYSGSNPVLVPKL